MRAQWSKIMIAQWSKIHTSGYEHELLKVLVS